jgi:acyl carrier protein
MTSTTRDVVLKAIERVCADKGDPVRVLSDQDALFDGGLGFDSLDMATIVAELDLALRIDPFAASTPTFRTVGDLIALYEAGDGR